MKLKTHVTAYLTNNNTEIFPANNLSHGREIAKRIVVEGLWVVREPLKGNISEKHIEEFYPTQQVYKVKVSQESTHEQRTS